MIIEASSDPAFRGDKTKYNPKKCFSFLNFLMPYALVSSFLFRSGIIVTEYTDFATGIMTELENGSGHFTEVILHPEITVSDESMIEKAKELHQKANKFCFIANSVNFPIKHIPKVLVK
jgi:organic hydroperoxide reductase OsmC/OhrA